MICQIRKDLLMNVIPIEKEIFLQSYIFDKDSFSDQLKEIRKTSMARIICDNTKNIDKIQPLVFEKHNKER